MTDRPPPHDLSEPERALASIRWAHRAIAPYLHRTPLVTCHTLSRLAGVELQLKCENLQLGGAFKLRGALATARSLSDDARARGLITYSSGNHAQGVALAARLLGTRALVVMPVDARPIKVRATAEYGAEIVHAGQTSDERRAWAEALASERQMTMVPPFDHPMVIAGQGTVGLEILQDCPAARAVFVPIGGGGLIAGVTLAVKALNANVRVVGVEPEGAARASASLAAGRRVRLERVDTVADGLRPLALGEHTWEVVRQWVDEVVVVSDAAILAAVGLLAERAKLVVEPSGAAALAAALLHARRFAGPAAVILSGGNFDLNPALRSA
jgi:threonine dehydratase